MTGRDLVLKQIFDIGGTCTSDDIIPKTIIYEVPANTLAEIRIIQDFNFPTNGGIGVWARKDGVEFQLLTITNDFFAPALNQSSATITLESGDALFCGLSASPINISTFNPIDYIGCVFEYKWPF